MDYVIYDISHHHPVKDWSKAKDAPFLISKATQGTSYKYIDFTYDFIKNCEKYKIPYWLYTYLNKGDEIAQVNYMINCCKNKIGKYFVGYILDVEEDNSASAIKSALKYLSTFGYKTMLYTGHRDYEKYKEVINSLPNNCIWWEARYGTNDGKYHSESPCHSKVDLHQYTSNAKVSWLSGNVDANRLTGRVDLKWFTTPLSKASESITDKTLIENKKSVTEIAKEVIDGKWGYGTTRKKLLEEKGYDYEKVQKEVNRILESQKPSYYKKYTGKSLKIDEVFKAIGVPEKYRGDKTKRKPIAVKNGISNYKASATQNLKLIAFARKGTLKKV